MSELFNHNTPAEAPGQPKAGASIMDRAVCLSVEINKVGTRRKVKTSQIETDAAKDMVHVSKDILQSKALDEIERYDGETRRLVEAYSLPSIFRAGVYLVPIESVKKLDEQLEERASYRANVLVPSFLDEYEARVKAAEQKLGSLYNPADYRGRESVARLFGMTKRYMRFAPDDRLKAVDPDLYEREIARFKADIADATEEIKQVLRAEFLDLVSRAVDRLAPGPDGKKKIFRDSIIGNVNAFLDTFAARDLTDDAELAGLVADVRELVSGVDAADLRDSKRVRDQVHAGFEAAKAVLDRMVVVVDRPGRKIDLGELD